MFSPTISEKRAHFKPINLEISISSPAEKKEFHLSKHAQDVMRPYSALEARYDVKLVFFREMTVVEFLERHKRRGITETDVREALEFGTPLPSSDTSVLKFRLAGSNLIVVADISTSTIITTYYENKNVMLRSLKIFKNAEFNWSRGKGSFSREEKRFRNHSLKSSMMVKPTRSGRKRKKLHFKSDVLDAITFSHTANISWSQYHKLQIIAATSPVMKPVPQPCKPKKLSKKPHLQDQRLQQEEQMIPRERFEKQQALRHCDQEQASFSSNDDQRFPYLQIAKSSTPLPSSQLSKSLRPSSSPSTSPPLLVPPSSNSQQIGSAQKPQNLHCSSDSDEPKLSKKQQKKLSAEQLQLQLSESPLSPNPRPSISSPNQSPAPSKQAKKKERLQKTSTTQSSPLYNTHISAPISRRGARRTPGRPTSSILIPLPPSPAQIFSSSDGDNWMILSE